MFRAPDMKALLLGGASAGAAGGPKVIQDSQEGKTETPCRPVNVGLGVSWGFEPPNFVRKSTADCYETNGD